VVAFLIWDRRGKLADISSAPSWAGFPVLLLGISLYWFGELGGEFFIQYLSSWLCVVGLCWMHFGWRKLKAMAFPLGFALAMFPLPNFLNNQISFQLKLLSSQVGVAMMQLYGLSAYREGNVIDLGFTRLQVVDACSGLRYLIPLILLGLLLAYYYRGALWKKAMIVVSTVPLSILTNSLRIASVGILYKFWGPRVAEGFFHDFSGWFIFMATLVCLLLEMKLLSRLFPEQPQVFARNDDLVSRLPAGANQSFSPFLPAALLLAMTLLISQGVDFREQVPLVRDLSGFPEELAGWSGEKQSMEQVFIDELDLTDYVIIDFRNPRGEQVNFYAAYYASQSKGASIHSPQTCLPGGGWRFTDENVVEVPIGEGMTIPVNRVVMTKDGVRQLSYFWFPQRGRVLTSAYELKLYTFWDALVRQRTDGALVRLISPVGSGEPIAVADERLQAFTRTMVPRLNEFLPGS
jgi:exosortase D (VPLPA-CTERM-specific)